MELTLFEALQQISKAKVTRLSHGNKSIPSCGFAVFADGSGYFKWRLDSFAPVKKEFTFRNEQEFIEQLTKFANTIVGKMDGK